MINLNYLLLTYGFAGFSFNLLDRWIQLVGGQPLSSTDPAKGAAAMTLVMALAYLINKDVRHSPFTLGLVVLQLFVIIAILTNGVLLHLLTGLSISHFEFTSITVAIILNISGTAVMSSAIYSHLRARQSSLIPDFL